MSGSVQEVALIIRGIRAVNTPFRYLLTPAELTYRQAIHF